MATVRIGSARSSYGNTAPGDQNGGKEVSTQDWYEHSLGWVLLRAKDAQAREKIATAMERACANDDIGYSQATRNTLFDNIKPSNFDPAKTTKKVNTDCSALVRVCCCYAGMNVGDFNTASEINVLMGTGLFEKFTDADHCKSSKKLLRGDILNTRAKGHTAVVLSNGSEAGAEAAPTPVPTPAPASVLGSRILKNGAEGEDVKELQGYLINLGYDCGKWGADGDYGDATELAVRAFQKDHGCGVDGDYGPETHGALMKALEGTGDNPPEGAVTVRISGGDCWIRAQPNTDGTKLGVAKAGAALPYAGQRSEDGWLMVKYKDQDAWVSGKYAKLEG